MPPRRAMYPTLSSSVCSRLGHSDPTLTLAVYQQVLDMGTASVAALEQIMGATLPEAHEILCGRGDGAGVLVPNSYPGAKKPSALDAGRLTEG